MKKLLFAAALAALVSACGGGKQKQQAAEALADSLHTELGVQEALLEDVFMSLGDITANLNTIKEREGIVSSTAGAELGREPISAINEDIMAIDKLLQQNKATIARLEKSASLLREANVNTAALEKLITEMKQQVAMKDAEIADLKEELRKRDVRIEEITGHLADAGTQIDSLSAVSGQQRQKLNTAYYIIGSRKELSSRGIIEKTGLISKTLKLNETHGLEDMTQIDIPKFGEVMIGHKKVDVVTPHPEGSYELVGDGQGNIASLVILDKERFWEMSRVLVISYR